ncbi:MAG: hypothetical protein LBO66_03880 [Deltaproteobacteria bacterium]|jgi:hypothetical protein|nr:hypothetical protein [Deltaproteobacteria bacterium]
MKANDFNKLFAIFIMILEKYAPTLDKLIDGCLTERSPTNKTAIERTFLKKVDDGADKIEYYLNQICASLRSNAPDDILRYAGPLTKAAEYLFYSRYDRGEFAEAEKYYKLILEFFPPSSVASFVFFIIYVKLLYSSEPEGFAKALDAYNNFPLSDLPTKDYLSFAKLTAFISFYAARVGSFEESFHYYDKLTTIAYFIFGLLNDAETTRPNAKNDASEGGKPIPLKKIPAVNYSFLYSPRTFIAPNEITLKNNFNCVEYISVSFPQEGGTPIPKSATVATVAKNRNYFNSILIEMVVTQADILMTLAPPLIAEGNIVAVNGYLERLLANPASRKAESAIANVAARISHSFTKNAKIETLPLVEEFFEKSLLFIAGGGDEASENEAKLSRNLYSVYYSLRANAQQIPDISLKAKNALRRVLAIDSPKNSVFFSKIMAVAREFGRLGGENDADLNYARELFEFTRISFDEKDARYSDDPKFAKGVEDVFFAAIHAYTEILLKANLIEEANGLYLKYAGSGENDLDRISFLNNLSVQLMSYYLSAKAFDKDKVLELFNLYRIDSRSKRDVLEDWMNIFNAIAITLSEKKLYDDVSRLFSDCFAKYSDIPTLSDRLIQTRDSLRDRGLATSASPRAEDPQP